MAEIIGPSDPQWLAVLRCADHDVHHRSVWAEAEAAYRGWKALAVVAGDDRCRVLIPFLRRELDQDAWDAVSPYGYAGPAFTRGHAESEKRAATTLALQTLTDAGCVSLFLRTHPLLPSQEIIATAPFSEGVTLVVDLDSSQEERLAQMRSGHRYDIRRAGREGTTVNVGPPGPHLDSFHEIYNETLDRLGADSSYRFDREYIERLVDGLGDDLVLATAHNGGVVDAAALFTVARETGVVGYFLSGSRASSTSHQPVKLMIAHVMDWAAEQGLQKMFLGGGLGAKRDSLFEFKKAFGAREKPFVSYGLITDPIEYKRRTRESPAPPSGFFPEYRRPSGQEMESSVR